MKHQGPGARGAGCQPDSGRILGAGFDCGCGSNTSRIGGLKAQHDGQLPKYNAANKGMERYSLSIPLSTAVGAIDGFVPGWGPGVCWPGLCALAALVLRPCCCRSNSQLNAKPAAV